MLIIFIAVNPSRRSISNTILGSPPSNVAPEKTPHKYWGITVLILDDTFYQIYNVCFLPAPKKRK
jgi:hypothetical protein